MSVSSTAATLVSAWVSTPPVTRRRVAVIMMSDPFDSVERLKRDQRSRSGQHRDGSAPTGSYQVTLVDRGSRNVVAGEQLDKSHFRTPCGSETPRVRAEHRTTTPGVSSTPPGTVFSSSLRHPFVIVGGVELVVAASVAFIGSALAWSDWFDLLPGRYTGRVLGLLTAASLFVAFRYDPDAALRPFLAVGENVADQLTRVLQDFVDELAPAPTSPVPAPSRVVIAPSVVAP